MARYAVGDIQGCYDSLQELLRAVEFDWARDQLWCVGDLINRGPASLAVLRLLYQYRTHVRAVLGNHDLHFLAVYYGVRAPSSSDTLAELLVAPDVDQLAQWLRSLPLALADRDKQTVMVHAGIAPGWSLDDVIARSAEIERVLQGDDIVEFLAQMYGNEPRVWRDDLAGVERLRCITNYFTRMRFCTSAGELDLITKESAATTQENFAPWFHFLPEDYPRVIFGHWAALEGKSDRANAIALDTGCVWGNSLTAINLDTLDTFSIGCPLNPHLKR